MAKNLLLLFAICLFFNVTYSQPCSFEHTFGDKPDQNAVLFKPVADGYVIVGSSLDTVYQTHGYYVLKIDNNGHKIWDKNFTDAFSAYANDVAIMPDGTIAIVGTHAGILYSALAEVVLLDSSGDLITTQTYPPLDGWGTSGVGIENAGDSSLAITLYTDGFISTNFYSIYRLNKDLSTRWTEFVGYDGSFVNNHSLDRVGFDGYYSLGYYDYYFYDVDPLFKVSYIRRFTSEGQVAIDSLYQFNVAMNSIAVTNDGGAILCGVQDSTGQDDINLLKIDSTGNYLWSRQYGNNFNEEGLMAIQTNDGGYAVLSRVPDPTLPSQHDIMLLKTNAAGDSLWSRRFGTVMNEEPLHFEQTADSGYAILGSTNGDGVHRIYFVKTDSAGIVRAQFTIIAPGTYFCQGDSATLQIFPSDFASVTWSLGDTGSAFRATTTGIYYANVIDSSGRSFESSHLSLFFAQLPLSDLGPDTTGLCTGALLSNGVSGDLSLTYSWLLNNTLIPFENTTSVTPLVTGTYTLTARNYCGVDTDEIYVDTLFNLPSPPLINHLSIPEVCPYDSLKLSAVLDSTFTSQWYIAGDFNNFIIPGATDSIYYATSQGYYFIQITDQHGCINNSDPNFVSFDDIPSDISANGPAAFCQGGEIDLSVSDGVNYLWSTGDTTQVLRVDSAGDYAVTFTDNNGCPKISDTLTITILANPAVSLGNDTMVCNDIVYTFDPGPGFNNYLWNDGTSGETYSAFVTGNITDTQQVYVFVTDTNGCNNSDTAQIVFDICNGITHVLNESATVYPNPLSRNNLLTVESTGSRSELIIFDVTGKAILRKTFRDSISFIPSLNPGYIFTGLCILISRLMPAV